MKRTIRKQTKNDFFSRIERLDPEFASKKPSERFDAKPWEVSKKPGIQSESPFMMMGLGLAVAMTVMFGWNNPDGLKELLLQWGWPAQFLTYAMNGAAILVFGLVLLFFGNVFRIFNPRATGRWNAAGLVVGSLAGLVAFNIPDPYVQAGYAFIGFENATDVLDYAQERTLSLASIDWASVVMVSSSAK